MTILVIVFLYLLIATTRLQAQDCNRMRANCLRLPPVAVKACLAAILVVCPIFAQCDETCNAGDILWVKDTVAANRTFNGLGTAACYNDFTTPFGIEAAGVGTGAGGGVCDNAEVRIVLGVNNYGPASASWTSRSSATQRITFNFGTATGSRVRWFGYIDETTPCSAWGTGGCPIILDFDTGTGSGLQLNGDGATSARFVFEWLSVINAALDGVLSPTMTSFRNFEARDNGGDGIDTLQISSDVTFSRFTGNAGVGIVDGSGGAQSYIAYNRSYANTSHGMSCANSTCAFNLLHDNGGSGILISLTNANVIQNIAYSNTAAGIIGSGTLDNLHIVGNVLKDNGTYGLNLNGVAGRSLGIIEQNNYSGNVTAGAILGAGTIIRVNIDDVPSGVDTTPCTLSSPPENLIVTLGCQFSMTFPPIAGATTVSNLLRGAAQNSLLSVGSGDVAY